MDYLIGDVITVFLILSYQGFLRWSTVGYWPIVITVNLITTFENRKLLLSCEGKVPDERLKLKIWDRGVANSFTTNLIILDDT